MKLAHRISLYHRGRKWETFLEKIMPTPDIHVLDVGYSNNVRLEQLNYIERHYPYPHMLTALGILQPTAKLRERFPFVEFVTYDGTIFPFNDKTFDVCWSNAVIEHVGNRQKQLIFVKEIKRVAKVAFITTPNRYFPIEVHTHTPLLHLLPKDIFDRYLCLVGKKRQTGDYMNLLSLRNIRALLNAAEISEFEIIKNRLLGFVFEYVIIFKS